MPYNCRTGMRPEDYVVAATRLVVEHGISLDGYERPRPKILAGQDVCYAPYLGKQRDELLV